MQDQFVMQEAITITVKSSAHLVKDSFFARYADYDEESKVHKLLGGGKGWYCNLLSI